jgi:hypothetical protein
MVRAQQALPDDRRGTVYVNAQTVRCVVDEDEAPGEVGEPRR